MPPVVPFSSEHAASVAAPMQRANAVLSNNLPVCIIVLAKLVEKVFLREREKLKNVFFGKEVEKIRS